MMTPQDVQHDLKILTDHIEGELEKELLVHFGIKAELITTGTTHRNEPASFMKLNQQILDDMADDLYYNIQRESTKLCALEAQPKSIKRDKDIKQAKRDIQLLIHHRSMFLP